MPAARYQAVSRIGLAIGLIGLALWITADLLPALLWALIVAIAVWPLYARLERRWPALRGRPLLPAAFTLAIGLVVILPIGFGLVHAVGDAHDLFGWIAAARRQGIAEPAWVATLPAGARAIGGWWQANLATPAGAERLIGRFDTSVVLAQSRLLGSSIAHRAVIFAFMLIALFFLLKDNAAVTAQARIAGERLFGPAGERIGRQIILSVRGTIDGWCW